MRHSTDEAIAALRLVSGAKVLRVDAVTAVLPIAAKVALPHGSRRLWLIYTAEPKPAGVDSAEAQTRVLRIVDDETLQPAGATTCP